MTLGFAHIASAIRGYRVIPAAVKSKLALLALSTYTAIRRRDGTPVSPRTGDRETDDRTGPQDHRLSQKERHANNTTGPKAPRRRNRQCRGSGTGEVRVMPAPYSTKSIANFFLNKGFATKTPIDPLKIQKLVFFG